MSTGIPKIYKKPVFSGSKRLLFLISCRNRAKKSIHRTLIGPGFPLLADRIEPGREIVGGGFHQSLIGKLEIRFAGIVNPLETHRALEPGF
jgi:hypothetical protein